MPRKLQIAVFLCDDSYYRNYLQTGALDQLKQDADLSFFVGSSLAPEFLETLDNPTVMPNDTLRETAHRDLLDILMFRHAYMSSSFKYRVFRTLGVNLFSARDGGASRMIAEVVRKQPRKTRSKSDRRTARLRIIAKFGAWVQAKQEALRKNNPLRQMLRKASPDLILCPSSAYDPQILDAINAANELGIQSLLLIDNWDNASSKSIFWGRPSAVACWGAQSVEHVHRIQGITENVHAIGTPRFEVYRDLSQSAGSYVLFLGTALVFDEARVLEELNKAFSEGQFPEHVKKIIYRPHPMRQTKFSPDLSHLEYVSLDDNLSDFDWTGRAGSRRFPDLDQYGPVLAGAALVVGGYTSMMIEAALCGKPVLAMAHVEEGSDRSPHLVEALYEHFAGTEDIEGFTVCRDLTALSDDIKTALARQPSLGDPALQHIISFTETPYSHRLGNLVRAITKET